MARWTASGALLAAWAALLIVLSPFLSGGGGSAPAAAAPPSAGAAPPPQPPASTLRNSVSIAWAGDITPGSRYGEPPDEGRSLFGEVRPLLSEADLALGNLEGTLSVGGASKCGTDGGQCFSFQAPPENAGALAWAGFDLVNLANNHAFDFGASGQQQTVAALDAQGLGHTGLPGQVTVVRRGGIRIATVGFAPYPWSSDLRDLAGVRELVRQAAAKAELVVVLAHLGGEGTDQMHVPAGRELAMGEDRGDSRAFAHAAVEAGADLVLGSGPHVLRGIELYRGRVIAYSLGNFAGWHNFSTAGALSLSGLLTVRITPDGQLRGGKFTALRLSGPGVPGQDSSGEATAVVNELGSEDFGGTALRLLPDGSF